MADNFLGEIRLLPYTFVPYSWAACDGKAMSPQQNQALFALLGTTFGGNGTSSFNLPNLQGRAVLGASNGVTGRENRVFAQNYGEPAVTLTAPQMPLHTHTVELGKGGTPVTTPSNTQYLSNNFHASASPYLGTTCSGYADSQNTSLTAMILPTGGGQPHANMQPYLALNYCIALDGQFPYFS
jgi:microcystin-dependent protein